MYNRFSTTILYSVLFFGLLSSNSMADPARPTRYQFEMIVYSDINAATLSSETWPNISAKDYKMLDIQSPQYQDYLNTIQFQKVKKSQFLLQKELRKLQTQPDFHLIGHLTWTEQVPDAASVLPIRIYSGNAYDTNGNILATEIVPDSEISTYPAWQMNGEVSISLNRYFDTRFNLLFAEPTSQLPIDTNNQNTSTAGDLTYFHLLQTRRTKSDELNYIDNPLYRVLFIIKKVS